MRIILIASTLLVGTSAVPSQAAIVNFVIEGRLSGIQFDTGTAASEFLAITPLGSSFRFSYSYDTNTAPSFTFGPFDRVYSNVLRNATLTIAGQSGVIRGFNFVAVRQPGVSSFPSYDVSGNFDFGSQINGFNLIDTNVGFFDTRRLADPGPGLPISINPSDFDTPFGRVRFNRFGSGEAAVLFEPLRVTSSISAVPEPAVWMTLVFGFGLVGGAMRHRRATAKVSFA